MDFSIFHDLEGLELIWKALASALVASLLAGCGHVDFDNAQVGRFSGSLFVMWIGDGTERGDGRFVFVPHPDDRLSFFRAGSDTPIRPEMMYTDGGSIPKFAQVFKGFSPWGYAPAYMIHDWLFVARNCLTDGMATKEEQKVANITFDESALIIAEAIQTLIASRKVSANDVSGQVISNVVAGPISRAYWENRGACTSYRVSDADRAAAEAGIPGSSRSALRGMTRTLPDGQQTPVAPAQVVGTFSF